MTYRPPSPLTCWHLGRGTDHCGQPSIVVVTADYDTSRGIGACHKHITPVLMFQMEKLRGEPPDRSARVVPAWRWEGEK